MTSGWNRASVFRAWMEVRADKPEGVAVRRTRPLAFAPRDPSGARRSAHPLPAPGVCAA